MPIARIGLTGLLLLSLALALTLPGCKKIEEKRQANDLEATLNSYENTLRWKSIADAYSYRPPEEVARTGIPDGLDQIRIVSYRVKAAPAMLNEVTAAQTVELGYYHQDTQRVKTLLDRQLWNYDMELKIWRLGSDIPEFR
jgi:hypothetical protein